jgi:hypothetical protein
MAITNRWYSSLVVRGATMLAAAGVFIPERADAKPEGDQAQGSQAERDDEPAATPESEDCVPACRPGYACAKGKCVSACNPPCAQGEICTAALTCVPGSETRGPSSSESAERDPDRERSLVGVRGLAGLVFGAGLSLHAFQRADGNGLQRPTVWPALLFAFRGGLLVNHNEVSLELAPGTYEPVVGNGNAIDNGHWITSFLGCYAHHIRMARGAYWPLRVGIGLVHRGAGYPFTPNGVSVGVSSCANSPRSGLRRLAAEA